MKDEGGRREHEKKLFKKRFRLDVRKCVFSNRVVDRWLSSQISDISSQKNVLNVVLLILLKSTSRLSWNRRVTVCYEDSGRYVAKACVDLCHQCLWGTGGFGEFGELKRRRLSNADLLEATLHFLVTCGDYWKRQQPTPHYAWLWTLVQVVNRTSGQSGSASEDEPAVLVCSRSRMTLGLMPMTPGGLHMTASLWRVLRPVAGQAFHWLTDWFAKALCHRINRGRIIRRLWSAYTNNHQIRR